MGIAVTQGYDNEWQINIPCNNNITEKFYPKLLVNIVEERFVD